MYCRRFFIAFVLVTLSVVGIVLWKINESGLYVFSYRDLKKSSLEPYTKNDDNRRFLIKRTFRLPAPKFTKSSLLQNRWVEDLKLYLRTLKTTQLSIVTASEEHKMIVTNWLVSAQIKVRPPLANVLVLAVSSSLYEYLKSRSIPVIYVDPASVISSHSAKVFSSVFAQIHVVRLTFFRLINHWGYDVAMYDSDAILLKNTQPLFDKHPDADIVGSAGVGPEKLSSLWGRTLCTGVLLLRATPRTEHFWTTMSTISSHFTDQGLVNEALFKLQVRWNHTESQNSAFDMHGLTSRHQLRAVILSEDVICRYTCDKAKKQEYFAWHKPAINKERTIKNKIERALDGEVWYLTSKWNATSQLAGVRWLESVTRDV